MSVCNLYIEAHRIRVQSDTLQYAAGTPVGFTPTKIHVAGRGVCVVRGWTGWTGLVRDLCRMVGAPSRSGGLKDAAPVRFPDAPEHRHKERFEVVYVGREDDGTITAVRAFNEKGRWTEIEALGHGVHVFPAISRSLNLRADMEEDGIRRVALAQWQMARKHFPEMCVGGNIQLATVTPGGVSRDTMGEYPDKGEYVRMFAERPEEALADA